MKEYVLSYYPKFCCVAGECKHTCCAGWEMCIDKKSLENYKNDTSSFSKTLKRGINFTKAKFKTDKKVRCAFLNDRGLCEIIINLGEQSLCQVCRDHPRFRSFFNDRVETGLGFCCETATKLILTFEEKIALSLVGDNNASEELDFNQKNLLTFRQKAIAILQDRSLAINDRIDGLLSECKADLKEQDFNKVIKRFLSLERIDKCWTKRLKSINKKFNKNTNENLSHYAEQFLVNSLYRHLADAEDTMWVRARTIAIVLSWWVVKSIIEQELDDKNDLLTLTIDVVREFSLEVEYSQKNLDKLFDFAYRFINV